MSDQLKVVDVSNSPKWRVFDNAIAPGTSAATGEGLAWSVSPGERTVVGLRPEGSEIVDLTHVRAMFRVSGEQSRDLINRVCGLDLSDDMFGDGAAARTLFAGVATEIVRNDMDGERSYLVIPSRSYSTYVTDVIFDAGTEFGL